MSDLRRYNPEGRPVFVAFVTYDRAPMLIGEADLLLLAYRRIRYEGVKAVAWVVLPDHIHAILELGPVSLSDAVRVFKAKFAGLYRSRHGLTKGRIWQHRFWDHIIRDAEDYRRHLDYIHYNPVKHGLVTSPFEHRLSSLHQWARGGYYDRSWGSMGTPDLDEEYGE